MRFAFPPYADFPAPMFRRIDGHAVFWVSDGPSWFGDHRSKIATPDRLAGRSLPILRGLQRGSAELVGGLVVELEGVGQDSVVESWIAGGVQP